jgi:outer membrane receptor for ferrienterochelin and colicins
MRLSCDWAHRTQPATPRSFPAAATLLLCFLPFAALCQSPSPAAGDEEALLGDLPVVEAAALHAQSLEDTPASVTVITEEDILKYGFRTLGEALASVRGFYTISDRNYTFVGLRGLNLPGDYTTRILVMIDGHYMTDRVYNSAGLFGQDFGLDMDLVHRIEIVRGPTSALYGSNGMLATINIITKSPADFERGRVSAEAGSYGEKKALVAGAVDLGHGANLLVAGSVFNTRGPDLYFPEFDQPAFHNGIVKGADGERGYHAFANLIWHNWSFVALVSDREKQIPISWGDFAFGDPGSKTWDGRNFVEGTYTRQVHQDGQLQWRVSYDWYTYRASYRMLGAPEVDNQDHARSDWLSSRLAYRRKAGVLGDLTIGGEVVRDLVTEQRNYDIAPERVDYVKIGTPDTAVGLFVQDELRLGRRWKADLGVRLDVSHNFGAVVSPRLALLYQRSPKTTVKLLYGRSFRNPSAYEAFFDDGMTEIANPKARPERADTFEAVLEKKLGRRWEFSASGYYYWLKDFLEIQWVAENVAQYANIARIRAGGGEAEIKGLLPHSIEAAVSLALQTNTVWPERTRLPNSPVAAGKFRLAVPLGRCWTVSSAGQFLSDRDTLQQQRLGPVFRWDATLSAARWRGKLDLVAGVRNLLGQRYRDPAAINTLVDSMEQNGRTVFLKVTLRMGE